MPSFPLESRSKSDAPRSKSVMGNNDIYTSGSVHNEGTTTFIPALSLETIFAIERLRKPSNRGPSEETIKKVTSQSRQNPNSIVVGGNQRIYKRSTHDERTLTVGVGENQRTYKRSKNNEDLGTAKATVCVPKSLQPSKSADSDRAVPGDIVLGNQVSYIDSKHNEDTVVVERVKE
ncbi:hypothetical protein H0H92_005824 [Tricholoma furcatifolium]|nr:hypothetical protein H0H92_005824 [Tricholoma furcatifolium]